MKNVFSSAACDFRHCVLEPFRNTTLVAVVSDEDANAQTTEISTWKLMSDIELIDAELASARIEPARKAFLFKEQSKLRGNLDAARAREAGGPDEPLARLRWTVERAVSPAEEAADEVDLGTGRSVTLSLNGTGSYLLSLSLEGEPDVHVHYVLDAAYRRRDIESLRPADRSAFFHAVQVMYTTPAAEGRHKYGPSYRSMDEIWAAHALLGGDGTDHALLRGAVDSATAEALLADSKPHRVPSEEKTLQGHHFDVKADGNDWAEVGRRFKAAALQHEQRRSALRGPAEEAALEAASRDGAAGGEAQAQAQAAVGADGRATRLGEAEAAARHRPPEEGLAPAYSSSSGGGGGVQITVEGRWAYFPVFTSVEPSKGEGGKRGQHDYKGYAVPLVVADVAPGEPNPFESTYTLPPIATDHHHEMKDGQLFHTHGKGGAHRHV